MRMDALTRKVLIDKAVVWGEVRRMTEDIVLTGVEFGRQIEKTRNDWV